MSPRRPYMLRAFYEWLVDNELTPHIVVDATVSGVKVPSEFIQDGQIVLNIASRAVSHLELGNDVITFQARFSGRPHSVIVPLYAVQALYARENGAGTMFEPEEAYLALMEKGGDSKLQSSPKLTAAPDYESDEDKAKCHDDNADMEPKIDSHRSDGVAAKPVLRVVK